jgi:hypothetical protein
MDLIEQIYTLLHALDARHVLTVDRDGRRWIVRTGIADMNGIGYTSEEAFRCLRDKALVAAGDHIARKQALIHESADQVARIRIAIEHVGKL